MMWFTRWTLLGTCLALAGVGCAEQPVLVAAADGVHRSSKLAAPPAGGDPSTSHVVVSQDVDPFPVPVIELSGSPQQLGAQQGQELADSIHTLHREYLLKFLHGQMQRMIALAAATAFESQVRPEHLAEVRALADATGIDERETMLGQCFLDLADLSACSTIALPASASPDGVARMGRNLEFPSLNVADRYTTLEIFRPEGGRYSFAAIGWPGMVGVLSGMNHWGLCLANMEVPRTPRLPQAMPYTLLYRTVLERCRSVDEAIALLQSTPIQTANNLMLMDAAGGRAVVELSPAGVHVRRAGADAPLVSTNHQRDQDAATPGRCWRYDLLMSRSTAGFGTLNEPAVENLLGHVGFRSTLQSMVFEPATRTLYLAAGSDAAHRTFHRIDLAPLLVNDAE